MLNSISSGIFSLSNNIREIGEKLSTSKLWVTAEAARPKSVLKMTKRPNRSNYKNIFTVELVHFLTLYLLIMNFH